MISALDFDADLLRADLIQQLMCQSEIPIPALERRYGIHFHAYFVDALKQLRPLQADRLVDVGPKRIEVTARGRLLMRNIAMCFDRYLQRSATASRFSKTI